MRVELNPDTYQPLVPYPQALNKPKAKVSESDDHLLEAFQKVTITILLVDSIKHIPSYAKFLKGICTPHRSTKRIQLSENISSIMMNSLLIKKRDPGAPMIMSEIGGMTFTRSLLDTRASINILPKAVYDRHHVGELQPFLIELCLADGSVRKPHGIVEDVIVRIEGCYFPVYFLVVDMKITKELSQSPIILGRPFLATAKAITDWGKGEVILKVREHTVKVNINKLMKYPSQAFEDLGAIDLFDDQGIETCIEEVMTINDGDNSGSGGGSRGATATVKYPWPGQGVAVIVAAAAARRRAIAAVGLLLWGARSGGDRRGDGGTEAGDSGGWTPSPAFREQPFEMEETPFFSQMTARVFGGSLPLLWSPKWAGRGKGPLEAHNPKPKILIENKGSQRERASRMGSRQGKNPPGSLKGR